MELMRLTFPKKKSKYSCGPDACRYCQTNKHKQCRPPLFGTVCGCSCPDAVKMKEHYLYKVAQAKENNQPEPTVEEALRVYRPGKRRGTVKINALNA